MPAIAELSGAVRRLCDDLTYFGIFEVEFIWFNGSWAVIDFNPRVFNQIAMDIHRGMPLPLLACLDAAGESAALRMAVAKAETENEFGKTLLYDQFTFNAILLALIFTKGISRQDLLFLRSWTKQNAAYIIDIAADASDRAPGIIHAISETYLGLKAIRRFCAQRYGDAYCAIEQVSP